MELNDFSLIKKEDILLKVSQDVLWETYFGDVNLNKKYTNPLRDDGSPDCTFIYGTKGDLIFHDWAKGKVYTIWEYVGEKYTLKYKDVIKKIALDFNIQKRTSSSDLFLSSIKEAEILKTKKLKKHNKLLDIYYLPTKITEKHIEYWSTNDYIFNEFTNYEIYPIKQYSLVFENFQQDINTDFGFAYKISSEEKQIYNPYFEPSKKFRQIVNNPLIGLDKVDYNHKTLIITKSYKDSVILRLCGFNVCCILSERYKPSISDLMKFTKIGKVYTLFDNDSTGREVSEIWKDTYFTNPIFLPTKDPYLYYKMYGKKALTQKLNELMI